MRLATRHYYKHIHLIVDVLRDEAAGIIASQHRKKESGALAAYEDQLNEVRHKVAFYGA